MEAPLLSFVIPVRNDAARLRDCLASIAANRPAASIEIIVVDNGSTDGSGDVARAAGARVLDAPGRRVSEMRNMAAAAAAAPILAFVDADHVIAPDWVATATRLFFADARTVAVGALCQAPLAGTWVQRAYDRLRRRRPGQTTVPWLGAGNLAVRRDRFEAVGGFDVTLETCEDVDLCRKLGAAGGQIVSDDRLVNHHLGDPPTLGALFRGELWRGRGNLAVSFRPPVKLRELPSALIPVIELAGSAAACVALVVYGRRGLAAAAGGLAPLVALSAVRAFRMGSPGFRRGLRDCLDDCVVALVYDAARAAALVSFAGHEVRRRPQPQA